MSDGEKAERKPKPIQLLRERRGPVDAALNERVKHSKQAMKALRKALKESPGTPPEIAGRCELPVAEVFRHLVAMVKYHEATFIKEDYADYFIYQLKED